MHPYNRCVLRTALLVSVGDLGDTILTVPALRALRIRYPDARLLLLAKSDPGDFVKRLGLVDEVIAIDKHGFDRAVSLANPLRAWTLVRLFQRLRHEQIDAVAIFHHLVTHFGTAKYAALALASGARDRVGVDNGRGWFLTRSVRDEGFGSIHEAQYWLGVAALLDAPGELVLDAPISDAERSEAHALLRALPAGAGPVVAVHAGVGGYAPGRRWDPCRFGETMTLLHRALGTRFVVVGTEADRQDTKLAVQAAVAPVLDLVGRTSVGVLAAVLQECDVTLANDGGVGHLAAAVGSPVVSVFGPSNDLAWRPLGAVVVAADLPCRPCLYRDFETGLRDGCGTRQCLQLVTPAQVADAVAAALTTEERRVD
jgi:ADP-heptose:LPS heptosyltransferase